MNNTEMNIMQTYTISYIQVFEDDYRNWYCALSIPLHNIAQHKC